MNLKLIAALVAAGFVLCTAVYFAGKSRGKAECVSTAAVTYQEGVKRNASIDRKVSRMAEPDLDNSLSYWVQ